MTILSAVLQGILQGLTEFLPVSSSGHLSVYQYLTGISSESSLMFSVLLHFGTLAAVIAAFYKTIWGLVLEFISLLRDIFTGRLFKREPSPLRRMIYMLIISCLPLLVVLLINDKVASISTDDDILLEGIFFLCTALILAVADWVPKGHVKAGTQRAGSAIGIGVAQAIATLPGISRSGSTISAGLILGLDRAYAVEYSFILGIPAILGAGVLELKDAVSAGASGLPLLPALIGTLVAAVTGLFAIKLVQYIVRKDRFRIFAWYTFALGILVVAAAIIERLSGHMIQHAIMGLIGG